MLISIVIRTLNEETHLDELLQAACNQRVDDDDQVEIVVIDSGSTDRTLDIARTYNCRITHIDKNEFSFGRSLNKGCEHANGETLVFVSGHCVPARADWLKNLIAPLKEGTAAYSYGRQLGRGPTKFSERRVFLKYFPEISMSPQSGFFANNANAALTRQAWERYRFDEEVTGLEDMELAKRIVTDGGKVAYIADAAVYHIHDERWGQVRNRYEREGMALVKIMPEASMSLYDLIECTLRSIAKDSYAALRKQCLTEHLASIIAFRTMQYWGSYRGTRLARMVARAKRRSYFYPDKHVEQPATRATPRAANEPDRIASNEGK